MSRVCELNEKSLAPRYRGQTFGIKGISEAIAQQEACG